MRGLDATEWEILVSSAYPDPCDETTDCEDCSVTEALAEARLVKRGVVVMVPCVYWPSDKHPDITPAGRLLLSMGRAAVVGS